MRGTHAPRPRLLKSQGCPLYGDQTPDDIPHVVLFIYLFSVSTSTPIKQGTLGKELIDPVVQGELGSFPVLRNAGVTGFKAALNPPAGLGVAQQQVLSAFHRVAGPGLACVAWLYGRAGAGTRTPCTPVSASLPCAHPSSLPAPPSASGRPGRGGGETFSAWRLTN